RARERGLCERELGALAAERGREPLGVREVFGGALDHACAGADPAGAAAERGAEVALRQAARERLLSREERVVARAEAGRRIGGGEERAAALERAVGKAERERRREAI